MPVRGMGRSLFGRGQIIRRDPATGVLAAGSYLWGGWIGISINI